MIQGFRSRLALTTLLMTLGGFALIVVVFTQTLPFLSSQEKQRDLQAQAHRFAAQVTKLYTQRGSSVDLQKEIVWSSQILRERIIITDPSGRRIAFDSARSTSYYSTLNPDLSPSDLGERQTVTRILPNHVVVLKSAIQGTHGHRHGGIVLLVAQATDLQPGFTSLLGVSVIAAVAALIVWIVVSLFLAASIFQPLVAITRATKRMARGDYSARVGVRGRGELAQLAAGFNEMAQQVQTSDRTMRDFVANVSHDLRTPLTMIVGFSQALLDGIAGPSEVESSADIIHAEAAKMQRLVDDLTQLTRLESGLLTLQRHPADLRPLAQAAIDHVVRARPGQQMAIIHNRIPADTAAVLVDADRVERVLRNLIDNAARYTPPEGEITIEGRPGGRDWVEVEVRDTGAGIPADDVPRIFERFYRSDRSRERVEGHSGLGLAIVREVVEAHGGQVAVRSEVGRGTTFTLKLPTATGQAPARAEHREAPHGAVTR